MKKVIWQKTAEMNLQWKVFFKLQTYPGSCDEIELFERRKTQMSSTFHYEGKLLKFGFVFLPRN